MHPFFYEILSTVLFVIAIIHTFLVSKFKMIANRYPKNSVFHKCWHLFSEIELVFGIWFFIFLMLFAFASGIHPVITYLESLDFTGPVFVFVIMCIAATRPVILFAENIIIRCSKLLPFSERLSFYFSTLIIGPLLGSFITEPAAMTVTAMILLDTIYKEKISLKLKYATIALLFVNVSIGGTLTHFAAPPVLMVASKWQWGTLFMLGHFGYKSMLSIIISTSLYTIYFRKELKGNRVKTHENGEKSFFIQFGKTIIHLLFLFSVVIVSHRPIVFCTIFFFFISFIMMTRKDQDKLKIRESLLVSLFLAGLIGLGTLQAWWLRPLLSKMGELVLFFGSTVLTSFTDNAAITYLGSMVSLTDSSKYALVAGAVAGGGLTVIANAPNPVGFGILGESFGKVGISPLRLFLWAIIPTLIGVICLLALPSINFLALH